MTRIIDGCLVAAMTAGVVALVVLLAGHPWRAALILAAAALGKALVLPAALLLGRRRRPRAVRAGTLAVLWVMTAAFTGFAALSVAAFAADWPTPLARFLGLGEPSPRPGPG